MQNVLQSAKLVFPARAGMSPGGIEIFAFFRGVPRASGDEPNAREKGDLHPACSPRERG